MAFDGKGLTLDVPGTERGKCKVYHRSAPLDGPPITIPFDPKYLLEASKAFEGLVRMDMNGPEKPAVFRSEGYLYLVVPLV